MEVKRTISKHQILEQFYPHIVEVSKQFCKGKPVHFLDVANSTYLVMHGLSVNKLTKILYDGGMKPYLWFVVQTEFAKEIGTIVNNNELLLYNLTDEIDEKTDKFFTLNDTELKFICILASNNSLYELTTKYGLPRRYCNNMLNKIKQKLK